MPKPTDHTNRRYLDAIDDHVVLFDGAMGTSIQNYNPTIEDFGGQQYEGCVDYLVITRPDMIREIHASFLAVGSEVVETNTFRGNRLTLEEYGLGDRVLEINRAAAALARDVCDEYEQKTGVPRFVAGSMGPSGKLPSGDDPSLSDWTFAQLSDLFYEQAQGLVEGGADLLLLETSQDILEVKAAVEGINRYFADAGVRIPIQAQITLDTSGRMLFGTDIAGALVTLDALSIDVFGMNCSTGPEYMRQPIQYLVERSPFPISVLPNAGLPINVDGEAVYPMEPEPFSDMVSEFARWGVSIVGGCCGTRPEHLDLLYRKVHGHSHQDLVDGKATRPAPKQRVVNGIEPQASSGMTAARMINDPGPTLIGERVNSQGSRKVKKLLLADDYDSLVEIAVGQVENGAHMLDVCVALTERDDELEQMEKLVKKLSMAVEVPLIIDTTETDVAETALSIYPGKAVINGNNLENGRDRVDSVFPLAKKYGAAVMSMTIDEEGMAHTRDKKLEIAQRITDIAVDEYGLKAEDQIFDVLTFPLTTGQEELRNDAVETIEALKLIKQNIPGVLTSLGISNVSFGVSKGARAVLNSVFLYHCVQAGLDMAIVNPAHIKPYSEIPDEQRKVANDLIFNTDPDALPRFIQYFEKNDVQLDDEQADPTEDMTSEEAIHWQIVHRKKDGVEKRIDDSLTRNDPVWVLNNVLLPAMKEVGDKFGAGELILPFVLQSAEVMKKSVAHLEQFMEKVEGSTKGTVVLATVYGDVHDIGKNLVKTILSNNGYTVHDIGKQVPVNTIIEKAQEYNADAIGLSALLVSTSKQMPLVVNELARRGLEIPVLVGGAAINRKFGRRILFLDDSGEPYTPGVFYCKDAFEGLAVVDKLIDKDQRDSFVTEIITEAYDEIGKKTPAKRTLPNRAGKKLAPAEIPTPPFWGARVIEEMPLEIVFKYIHKPELFRLSWGAKNAKGEEWERIQAEFEARLTQMQKAAIQAGTLQPQATYGYFPANSDGDALIIWDHERYTATGEKVEAARFMFPRQPGGDFVCISDYYAAIDSGKTDVVTLQVVTVGEVANDAFDELQNADNYSEAYFFHGLAVQTAEAVANYVTRHVTRELGIPGKRGKRYSWGYPACPDLEDHTVVFNLLPGVQQIGMSLTSSYQLVPEQSTAAIYAHHPDAKYFSVGVDRTEQLLAE